MTLEAADLTDATTSSSTHTGRWAWLASDRIRWGWIIFGVAFLGSLGVGSVLGHDDPYYFGAMGRSIADGHAFEGYGNLITRRAPLYPLVLGGLFYLVGGHDEAAVVLHAFMFAGTAVLAFDIGRRMFNRRTGVFAGILCMIHPMLLRYVPSLHLETQLTFLFTLTVWLMVRFYEKPSVRNGAFVGAIGAAAALTKAVMVFYPVVFAIGIILACAHARRRGETRPTPWKPFLAMFLLMAAVIAPWTVRNYRATHHFVPISSGTSDAFLRGFIFSETDYILLRKPPYTDAENASDAYFNALSEKAGTVWQKDDYETDQILNKEAIRRLKADPGEVARKTVIGVFTFWYQLTSLKNSLLALVLAIGAWIFAIVGWRRARTEHRPAWLLFAPILYLNIVLALLLALGRYSVPILPALVVMSAFGLDTLVDRWNGRRSDAAQ